jgi:hypothetical protein
MNTQCHVLNTWLSVGLGMLREKSPLFVSRNPMPAQIGMLMTLAPSPAPMKNGQFPCIRPSKS